MNDTKQLIDKALASLDKMPDSIYTRLLRKTAPVMLEAFTEELLKCRGETVLDFANEYPRVLAYYMKTARASLRHSFDSPQVVDYIEDLMSDSFRDAMDTASKIVGEVRHV